MSGTAGHAMEVPAPLAPAGATYRVDSQKRSEGDQQVMELNNAAISIVAKFENVSETA